jgi:hypothetical protein
MATAKAAIWLERNDVPPPIKTQNKATSMSGANAVAASRFNMSVLSARRAHLAKFLLLERELTSSIRASAPLGDYSNNDS